MSAPARSPMADLPSIPTPRLDPILIDVAEETRRSLELVADAPTEGALSPRLWWLIQRRYLTAVLPLLCGTLLYATHGLWSAWLIEEPADARAARATAMPDDYGPGSHKGAGTGTGRRDAGAAAGLGRGVAPKGSHTANEIGSPALQRPIPSEAGASKDATSDLAAAPTDRSRIFEALSPGVVAPLPQGGAWPSLSPSSLPDADRGTPGRGTIAFVVEADGTIDRNTIIVDGVNQQILAPHLVELYARIAFTPGRVDARAVRVRITRPWNYTPGS